MRLDRKLLLARRGDCAIWRRLRQLIALDDESLGRDDTATYLADRGLGFRLSNHRNRYRFYLQIPHSHWRLNRIHETAGNAATDPFQMYAHLVMKTSGSASRLGFEPNVSVHAALARFISVSEAEARCLDLRFHCTNARPRHARPKPGARSLL